MQTNITHNCFTKHLKHIPSHIVTLRCLSGPVPYEHVGRHIVFCDEQTLPVLLLCPASLVLVCGDLRYHGGVAAGLGKGRWRWVCVTRITDKPKKSDYYKAKANCKVIAQAKKDSRTRCSCACFALRLLQFYKPFCKLLVLDPNVLPQKGHMVKQSLAEKSLSKINLTNNKLLLTS